MKTLINVLKATGLREGVWTPEQAAIVLKAFAEWFPFENIDVMCQNEASITPEFLQEKLVHQQRGGICYEINPFLYLVLKELGFQAELSAATIYNGEKWALDRTHALVLLEMEGKRYVADSGFGSRLALRPLEVDGESVTSPAGTFRIRTRKTEKGSLALECKTDQGDWALCYAFDWEPVKWEELDRMKEQIHHHPHSPFNKKLLIARVLPDGTQSLNEERQHRKWVDGKEETVRFDTKEALVEAIRQEGLPALAEELKKIF